MANEEDTSTSIGTPTTEQPVDPKVLANLMAGVGPGQAPQLDPTIPGAQSQLPPQIAASMAPSGAAAAPTFIPPNPSGSTDAMSGPLADIISSFVKPSGQVAKEQQQRQQQAGNEILQNQIPRPTPTIFSLINAATGKNIGGANPGIPGYQPPTKLDHFENFLGNFLTALSSGFTNEGRGPGAAMRGAGAAMQAPYQQAIGQYQLRQQAQEQQARIAQQQAQTRQTEEQTRMLGTSVSWVGPDGRMMSMPYSLAKIMGPTALRTSTQEDIANKNIASREKIASLKEGIGIPVPEDLAKAIGLPEMAGTKVGKTGWAEINSRLAASGKDMMITDIGDKRVLVRKSTGETLRVLGTAPGLTAGVARAEAFARAKAHWTPFQTFDDEGNVTTTTAEQAIANGLPSASTWNQIFGPTGSTKSQGQAAGAVASHIPDFRQSIEALDKKGQLGAVMGRLNTYLTQGYGGDDQDISEFITTVGLLKSGAVRAHFGARGGAQILDKFDKLLNTAQTAKALTGSIDSIDKFLKTYKAVGTAAPPKSNIKSRTGAGAGGNTGGGEPPPAPKTNRDGYVIVSPK